MTLGWPFTCGNPGWKSLDGARQACTVATRIAPRRAADQLMFRLVEYLSDMTGTAIKL
jgi:hypothetical protein